MCGPLSVPDVLDTGVRISHDDFGGRAVAGWTAASGEYWRPGGVADATCSGHGTHCASTIAGQLYGVAKAATIVTVQV